jgi:hypothetical protein
VVSFLFIRRRLWAINGSSLKLKMFFLALGVWLVFECYQIVAFKDAVHHRGKGAISLSFALPLCPSRCLQRASEGK